MNGGRLFFMQRNYRINEVFARERSREIGAMIVMQDSNL